MRAAVTIANMRIGSTIIIMGAFNAAVAMVVIISRVTGIDVFVLKSKLLLMRNSLDCVCC